MKKKILDRYSRTADGKVIIDITADKIEYLYNDFDRHTPYVKKELDQNLADYLIDSMGEIGKEDFLIKIRLAERIDNDMMSRVQTSIHNYFFYLKELEIRELKGMRRTSFILLSIGIAILTLSVWFNEFFAMHEDVVSRVFSEGLTVAAWVSLWEALATFLISWAPHRQQIRLYERLAKATVLFREEPLIDSGDEKNDTRGA